MKKFLYYFFVLFFGFGVGFIVALLFAPYSSEVMREKVRENIDDGIEVYNRKKSSLGAKVRRISSNVDDIYRLYTHKDEIVPVNEVYSEEF